MARETYHHGGLRDALLDAAEDALAQGREPSLRELARVVGVSPNAPYRHFADKGALESAVAERGFARLSEAIADRSLEGMFAAYLAFARERPVAFRLMFSSSYLCQEFKGPQAQLAFEALSQAIAAELPPGAPFVASVRGTMVAWAAIHGYASLALSGALHGFDGPADPGAAGMAAIVRAGLRAEGGSQRG